MSDETRVPVSGIDRSPFSFTFRFLPVGTVVARHAENCVDA